MLSDGLPRDCPRERCHARAAAPPPHRHPGPLSPVPGPDPLRGRLGRPGVDFNPFRSDVDFLVEYIPPIREDWFDRHMGLIVDLEALLEREVDLLERANLRKPDLIASLEADAEPLYAADVGT